MEWLSPDHSALGRAVRQLREEQGLSQEALAHKVGVHRTYLGGIERGERNVSFANILRIATALDVSPSELFGHYERAVRRGLRRR
jgi:transcriptional regulator with XRE-family HTH domain